MQTLTVVGPDDHEPIMPAAFGRFEVRAEVGRGGMGIVYRAWDPQLRREVAVKRLRVRVLGRAETTELEARLVREARAMAALSHPNLLPIFDVGRADGDLFLAMEFVEGVTLREWLEVARPWREVIEVFTAAGRGLAAAHAARLVHRDFKPSNVLLSHDRVRVADFGLARPVDERGGAAMTPRGTQDSLDSSTAGSHSTQLTRAGEVMGTPRYMAPEQYVGDVIGPAADQYAFCVALFEALVGRPAFDASGPELVQAKHALKLAPFADSPAPPAVLRAVVRGLAPRPRDRFADMDELLRAIAAGAGAGSSKPIVVALAGAAAIAWIAWPSDQAALPVCGTSIEDAWSVERREQVETALRRDAAPFAAVVATRTAERLDRWAMRWSAASEETCVEPDLASAEREARLRCLAERKDELRVLVDALARGEVAANGAVQAAARLPRPDACRLGDGAGAWPDDPTRAAEVAAIRDQLGRGRALVHAGKYVEAIAAFEPLVARAEAVDHPPTLARALRQLGEAYQRDGQFALARATLERAYFLAREHHADDDAAEALGTLVYIVSYQDRVPEAARQWVPLAERELEREGIAPEARVSLLSHLGGYYEDIGDHTRAIATWERALEIAELELDADPLQVTPLLTNLDNAWSDRGDTERSLEYGLRSLATKEESLGPDHPSIGYSLNNLGATYAMLGRFDESLAAHERALAIRIAAHGEDHIDVGVSLANIGETYTLRGDVDAAEPYLERALALRRRVLPAGHADIGLSLAVLAGLRARQGKHELARAGFVEALAVMEPALGPEHPFLAPALTGLGRALVELKRPAEAVPQLERALALRKDAKWDPVEIANTSEVLARALWAEGRDRQRARTVIEAAIAGLDGTGERGAPLRAELETWLAEHASRGQTKRVP
jgi:eukaryotic-like serine/threonine-protein kinase